MKPVTYSSNNGIWSVLCIDQYRTEQVVLMHPVLKFRRFKHISHPKQQLPREEEDEEEHASMVQLNLRLVRFRRISSTQKEDEDEPG